MKKQQLVTNSLKAINKYEMIQDNDTIAVGISGGKDSLALLVMLSEYKKYFNDTINIIPIAVDIMGDNDYQLLDDFITNELNLKLDIVRTEINDIIFNVRKESNPCSLCSKMRKSALFTRAEELGCNKVALGHNKDDVLETFFMSLFEEGRLHTFPCNTYLDKTNVTIIRPMIYIEEKNIIGFINKYDLAKYVIKNRCKADGNTNREEMKNYLKSLRIKYDHIDDKLMGAIEKASIDGYKE